MKVDRPRAEEVVMRHFLSADGYGNRLRAIDSVMDAVREQTEWLMEEVCLHCGRKKLDHPLPDFDDGSCPCNKTGWYSVDLVTRAEHLHRKGEKP